MYLYVLKLGHWDTKRCSEIAQFEFFQSSNFRISQIYKWINSLDWHWFEFPEIGIGCQDRLIHSQQKGDFTEDPSLEIWSQYLSRFGMDWGLHFMYLSEMSNNSLQIQHIFWLFMINLGQNGCEYYQWAIYISEQYISNNLTLEKCH